MHFKPLLILSFLLTSVSLSAQVNNGSLKTVENADIEQLIKEVFLKGNCKNVSNIKWSGEPVSFGEFKEAGNVLGFQEGIILSSGNIKSAEGPNTDVEATSSFGNTNTDQDLLNIATNQLFDVTYIEFDFVPLTDQVSFQYVFASEEYCEFVGTIFNDVFGFFVSGPGINGAFTDGAINVARLPDSDEFVSINTVNHRRNSDNYVKNELEEDAQRCGISYNPNYLEQIEFDGFTIPLTARFEVIPCETYHIRLVVGDVGDDKLDSAVFLRSESFDIGELATVKAEVPNRLEAIAYEDCLDGQFVFTRPIDSDRNENFVVQYRLDELGTAIEGVDFRPIERSITIPAGENQIVLPIQNLVDEELEGLENLTLEISQACKCEEGGKATLQIDDALTPKINFPIIAACPNQSFMLHPTITEGVEPYTYNWSDNSTDSFLIATINEPTTYGLTVTDFCGNSIAENFLVDIQAVPKAQISGNFNYCEGQVIPNLTVDLTGNAPWSFTYSINGNSSIKVDSILNTPYLLATELTGNYTLTSFNDAACNGTTEGLGIIKDIGIALAIETKSPTCPKDADGSIELFISKGQAPYQISWSEIVNDPIQPTNLPIGQYEVSIIDEQNCALTQIIEVTAPTILLPTCENNALYIPNVFSPNGDGQNDFFEIFVAEKTSIQTILSLRILDRWGNLVYFSEADKPKWDGTAQGKKMNIGVFMYEVMVELADGQTALFQGDVSLIR